MFTYMYALTIGTYLVQFHSDHYRNVHDLHFKFKLSELYCFHCIQLGIEVLCHKYFNLVNLVLIKL